MPKEEKKSTVVKEVKEDMALGGALGLGLGGNPFRRKKSTVKEHVKKPAANSLSKQRIDKLFRMFCVYEVGPPISVDECSACILRDIPWVTKDDCEKDLCYAIWGECILNV